MDYKRRIEAIMRRAERARVELGELCAAARLNKSTFYRWRQDDANPRLRSMLTALGQMEAELSRREQALVAELARDNPGAVVEAVQSIGDVA
jgi:DNA-binding phage protein